MKRILIVTYYWPPSGGSGVQRWLKFSKYLPQFGWQPIIYTPENPDFSTRDETLLADIPPEAMVIKKPIWEPYHIYRLLNRGGDSGANFGMASGAKKTGWMNQLSVWIRGNWFVPDPRVFWVKPSVKFLTDYLKKHPVDAFATTGPPHSMHLIGLGLKKAFPKLTWVADFRDPWAKFDYLPEWQTGEGAMEKHRRLEKKVLDTADLVIMVTPSIHVEFQPFDYGKKVMITNGFDEEDFQKTTGENRNDTHFKIYHTGLLSGLRNPAALWQAFEETCKTNPAFAEKFRLILVGQVDETVKESIRKHPFLSERTQYIAWLPHSEVIKENAKADAMLLIINQSFNAKTQLTGKLFEYLALGKPVLALCPTDGDAAAIVRDTDIGYPIDFEDVVGIKQALETMFTHYSKKESFKIDPEKILRYSRKQLTAQLVEALENQIFSPPIAKK